MELASRDPYQSMRVLSCAPSDLVPLQRRQTSFCGWQMTGRSRIRLRQTGEVFSLVPPNSTAHNLIMGSIWVDCHGTFSLTNVTTGAKCSLYFTPCGWFSAGRYEVRAAGWRFYPGGCGPSCLLECHLLAAYCCATGSQTLQAPPCQFTLMHCNRALQDLRCH